MRALVLSVLSALMAVQTNAAELARQFDGVWETTISCPNAEGALGFSYRFPSTVKAGVLHGEKGQRDQPGWLQLDGEILEDGSANLYAAGLIGAAPFAIGHQPAGTPYGYHVATQFTATAGTGRRVEGRACTVTFAKAET